MNRKPIPTPETSDSDFGAFVDALIADGARIEKRVAKPVQDKAVREWLERAHREVQAQRYSA
jgi:hypothetical protein